MKKKILSIALIVAMIAVIAAGSFAYFTDTDKADNVFTVGNVAITLNEQQRGANGLVDFVQSKHLYPIVGSAQGAKDSYGMPTAENYVDKMVTVTNTGSEDAYVRAYFAIPAALDDGADTYNAGLNVLHFNFGSKVVNDTAVTTYGNEWLWKNADGSWKCINNYEINGIKYNIYYADYATTLAAGATTVRFVDGVYLDKSFDMNGSDAYAFGQKLTLDEGWSWSSVKCPVFAVAVQAEGFTSADAAITAAFGANYNPWATT